MGISLYDYLKVVFVFVAPFLEIDWEDMLMNGLWNNLKSIQLRQVEKALLS